MEDKVTTRKTTRSTAKSSSDASEAEVKAAVKEEVAKKAVACCGSCYPKGEDLLSSLLKELIDNSDSASKFVQTLSRITKKWVPIGRDNVEIENEMIIPEGMTKTEFVEKNMKSFINGYKLETIFGEELAVITKGFPKWNVKVKGVSYPNFEFIHYKGEVPFNKVAEVAKDFAEMKLKEEGYIVPDLKQEK